MARAHDVLTRTRPAWSRLRLRQSAYLRDLVAETTFSVAQLIQPIFIVEGMTGHEDIPGLGDNARHGIASALDSIAKDVDAGVRHLLLFHVPAGKQEHALDFRDLARTVEAIKQNLPTQSVCGSTSACAPRRRTGTARSSTKRAGSIWARRSMRSRARPSTRPMPALTASVQAT